LQGNFKNIAITFKIGDPVCRELYSRRMQIVEPVFANITRHKGMDRFTLSMWKKADMQWKTFCMVHNIMEMRGFVGAKKGHNITYKIRGSYLRLLFRSVQCISHEGIFKFLVTNLF